LLAIEAAHDRTRGERWGPRTLDLDLLVYGEAVIDSPRLTVPHPQLALRPFVLVPLAEVAPGLVVPCVGRVDALRAACSGEGIDPMETDDVD
jgi:2-amino-4-hydroxy-6-hydroxymethyldihydropteridine diphosphokinase